jgi:hypothetical protein
LPFFWTAFSGQQAKTKGFRRTSATSRRLQDEWGVEKSVSEPLKSLVLGCSSKVKKRQKSSLDLVAEISRQVAGLAL